MATQILMPALSPTMEEGKLAKWLVKEGDEVHSGDILAEIETDKAVMEFEAVDEGRIGKILVPEGTEGVKVNQPIAELIGASSFEVRPSPSSRLAPQDNARKAEVARIEPAAKPVSRHPEVPPQAAPKDAEPEIPAGT
ncbi:MAG TPA: biotin/lipoyl-containing protein, partial [Rhizomicrobium sp.]|nr:biotin/lipoyl-containing protein [Rhizomicrobium sp.]